MTIYFIQAEDGLIKIGFTSADAKDRLTQMRTGSSSSLALLGVIEGDLNAEGELHQRFGDFRLHGEWFEPRDELIEFIRQSADETVSSYPGGKGFVYRNLINLIPPHRTYIEPFAGGGAVARFKRLAESNIAIDADAKAINDLRSTITKNGDTTRWEFLHADALPWLRAYPWRGDEFVYLDPPYIRETRRQSRRLYRCEMTHAEHEELLAILVALPCKVMISGYWSQLYADALASWHTATFEAVTRGGGMAEEWLWMNYPEPEELHQYDFLGGNFRERERIKRKATRWVKNFRGLPLLERQAIMEKLKAR